MEIHFPFPPPAFRYSSAFKCGREGKKVLNIIPRRQSTYNNSYTICKELNKEDIFPPI